MMKVRVVSLHATRILVLLVIPTKFYQNILKGVKIMDVSTAGRHADRLSPEPIPSEG